MEQQKNNLNKEQKQLLYKIVGTMAVVAVLFCIFGRNGLLDYYRNNQNIKELKITQQNLLEDNEALQIDVQKLENDPAYIEKIAREKHGLLKENEMIYDFSKP